MKFKCQSSNVKSRLEDGQPLAENPKLKCQKQEKPDIPLFVICLPAGKPGIYCSFTPICLIKIIYIHPQRII